MSKTLIALLALAASAVAAPGPTPGPLSFWGTSPATLDEPFVALAEGGTFQTLALRVDRTLFLSSAGASDTIPPIPEALAQQQFRAIGMGRNHALGIRVDGGISAWGSLPSAFDGIPEGRFEAVTGGGQFSVALDTDGKVVMWGGSTLPPADRQAVLVGAPDGLRYTAIAARGRYTIALSTDGRIFGWGIMTSTANTPVPGFNPGWTAYDQDHFVAPDDPGNPYIAIAAGLDHVAAIRADGTLVVWDPTGLMAPPPPGRFVRVAAGLGYALAIDAEGVLHGWGVPARAVYTLTPDGIFSEIAAGTIRASAIASPRQNER
jgi:alpha-tubulin suppressor-like RCC1 family protein